MTEVPSRQVVRLKRAYEDAARTDGYRILVDRLWPRGLRKEDAHLDAWVKELAPSDDLRAWFAHDPDRFPDFRARYRRELAVEPGRSALAAVIERAGRQTVTLVYAARDEEHNNAVVLSREIRARLARRKKKAPAKKPVAKRAPVRSRRGSTSAG